MKTENKMRIVNREQSNSHRKQLRARKTSNKYNRYKKRFNTSLLLVVMALMIVITTSVGLHLSDVKGEQIPAQKTYETIVIHRDDTLWSIANEYKNSDYYSTNSYIKEVKKINNLRSDKIITGTKLIIPIVSDLIE